MMIFGVSTHTTKYGQIGEITKTMGHKNSKANIRFTHTNTISGLDTEQKAFQHCG